MITIHNNSLTLFKAFEKRKGEESFFFLACGLKTLHEIGWKFKRCQKDIGVILKGTSPANSLRLLKILQFLPIVNFSFLTKNRGMN
ncbi:MAG: hypothetical protein A2156_10870 [Deltaproteobacteria bacterium RBG_16_48_10]|nr:MAG: hypothetical protein A2156_10870 [Deltaproteobacteria bacterium RBG_16_48_10]